MREIKGDIWNYYKKGHWIVITTNGTVKTDGSAVMGRGIALQAKQRCPELSRKIGSWISDYGNRAGIFQEEKVVTFPVKHNWWERATLGLIEKSCVQLKRIFGFASGRSSEVVYMVRPGCGNGQLDWKDVKSILEKYLDDRFIVVQR